MKTRLLSLLVIALAASRLASAQVPAFRDIDPDTWVATDAIGRTMPDFSVVGPVKTDQRRLVGIFYVTWHSDKQAELKAPYRADVTKVLAADPSARLDAKHPLWYEGSYHWGEPEPGYFLSKDPYVIRKDMSMLADAGVDVLVMDVTNAVRYWDEWDLIFPVMQKMKAEGNKVPAFCFWAFNGPVINVVQDLYDKIYKVGKYRDLWFSWDGKPLLLYNGNPNVDSSHQVVKHPNPHYDPKARTDKTHAHFGDPAYTQEFFTDYSEDVKKSFTLRTMWWGFHMWEGKRFVGTEDNWSFGYDLHDPPTKAMKPDDLVSRHHGAKEEAAVTPSQHPHALVGKSWTRQHGEPRLNEFDLPLRTFVPWLGKSAEHPEGYGIYFQERWDEAIAANPQFLYLNDWNEWTAGKYHPAEGKTFNFMRRKSPYFFVDQYNAEFNRTIQPMKGGYTDNYYMQMVANIRRYKGVRPIPVLRGLHPIRIDADFADWAAVTVEYRDTIGDVIHRDYPGYGGLHYRDESGRNDIITCKVAVDSECIDFYAETNEPLTPHTRANWMLLMIDADQNHETGWYGYDYLVNKKIFNGNTTALLSYDPHSPDGPWVEKAQVKYRYSSNRLELAIPRTAIGLSGEALSFDFHWCDNPAELKDPISLCTSGDSAPNRRFNYRCVWKK